MANNSDGASFNGTDEVFTASLNPLFTAYAAWIMVPITLTTLLANIFLITIYLKHSHLQTPFAVYIVSLATGDLAQTLTVHIHSIFTLLSIPWPLGQSFCIFMLYMIWLLVAFSYHMHVLVCTNRLWAVMFPAHYRLKHTKKVAVALVMGVVGYLNLWILPGFIVHVIFYSGEDGVPVCIPNYPYEMVWSNVTYIAIYFFPEFLVLVLYPIIWYKISAKVRKTDHKQDLISASLSQSGKGNATAPVSQQARGSRTVTIFHEATRPTKPRYHFAMLTALVMVAVLCWTPINTAYLLIHFGIPFAYSIMTPCTVIFFLDALLNPVIFLFSSREWREALKNTFSL